MSEFMNMHNLEKLMKQKTCFKNPENLSCMGLVLTTYPRSFQQEVGEGFCV